MAQPQSPIPREEDTCQVTDGQH
ncbi:hypothetical protein HaLaN_28026, partial [Haematococcus lacustris]